MPIVRNRVDERFGRLLVVGPYEIIKSGNNSKTMWRCLCACGKYTEVAAGNLVSGSIKSCGCLRKEVLNKTTHGMFGHELYYVWSGMMNRCYNSNDGGWCRYGGRGITVSKRWHDVRNFVEDMHPRPPGLSLDRKDNNGPYSKRNCRWATDSEQQSNKSTSRLLTYKGRTQTMSKWAKEIDMPVETLFARLKKLPIESALTLPRGFRSLGLR